ncbi:hypothetical protein Angca_007070 [Angiostrongylus cantonensis]|nr:hypothetical protein Angca_007070 [Angiostrongylus cantonensis]
MDDGSGVEAANNNHVKLSEAQLVHSEFGAPLDECYKLAVKCYKDKEKSGDLTILYEDRVKLMALNKQVRHGPFADSSDSAGWFDIFGNDITKAWRNLGQQSRIDSMASFVFLMDRVCPPFKKFISDHIESTPSELRQLDLSARSEQTVNWEVFEAQKKQIQDALNAQTFHQFSAYAQQQFPGQPEQQSALIRQLQEQHYQQYMSQVYAQHAEAAVPESERRVPASTAEHDNEERARDDDSDVSDEEPGDDLPSNPEIAPASLWNRKDIVEFKNTIKKEGSEGVIKVGYGETVTVRVPTHEDGTCLFWEFATDYYDIGFGVYFEWTIADSNQVSIHVSESDDEDEYDEVAGGVEGGSLPAQGGNPALGDVESGGPPHAFRDPNKPRQDEIIPVYRRDCHEEVYAGSHSYPGRGVYLLKFDNSYSLWRSKTLYYRVYYSK